MWKYIFVVGNPLKWKRIWGVLLFVCVLQPLKARQLHTGFRQMEENTWSCRDVWHTFYSEVGQSTHAANHKLHRGKSQLPYTLNAHKANRVPILTFSAHKAGKVPILTFRLYNRASFYACGPLFKAIWTLITYIYLDIWVREPNWLHCPYIPSLQGASPYNLSESVFCKGPLVRNPNATTAV